MAGGEARFPLLETMREFGRERLADSDELPRLLQRHAVYFLEASVTSQDKLTGPMQAGALRWLHREQADLCAALDWWRQQDHEQALRMAAALGMFWYMQGLLTEGRQQLRASLDATPTDSPHRATGLYALGLLEHRHADYADAGARFDAAEALFNARGDVAGVGRCRMRRAKILFEEGDTSGALRWLEDALPLLRASGDDWATAQTLHDLGVTYGVDGIGDHDRSDRYHRDALRKRRALGDQHAAAFTLFSLSQQPLPFDERREMVLEALGIFQRLDDRAGRGHLELAVHVGRGVQHFKAGLHHPPPDHGMGAPRRRGVARLRNENP